MGRYVVLAAHDLHLQLNVLRKWVREQSAQEFPSHDKMKPEQLEIKKLQRVAKLKVERDLLERPRPT